MRHAEHKKKRGVGDWALLSVVIEFFLCDEDDEGEQEILEMIRKNGSIHTTN